LEGKARALANTWGKLTCVSTTSITAYERKSHYVLRKSMPLMILLCSLLLSTLTYDSDWIDVDELICF